MAVLEARQVHVAAGCAVEEIAAPQQAVAVEVDDGQRLVQRLRMVADDEQQLAVDLVGPALDHAGREQEEGGGKRDQQDEDGENPATHQRDRKSTSLNSSHK